MRRGEQEKHTTLEFLESYFRIFFIARQLLVMIDLTSESKPQQGFQM